MTGAGPPELRVWHARFPSAADGSYTIAAVVGDAHPDNLDVEVTADADIDRLGLVLYRAGYAEGGRLLHVAISPVVVPRAPTLWYVKRPEPDAVPQAMNLVAFASDHRPAGTIASADVPLRVGVGVDDQVGALRWWTGTGQVHQVYVSPTARRTGVGTSLSLAAAALAMGRGWSRLWGSGELTDSGAAWTSQAIWASRVETRTEWLEASRSTADLGGVIRRDLGPETDRWLPD